MRGRLVPFGTAIGFATVLGFVGLAARGTYFSTAVAHAVTDPVAREVGAAAIETPDSPTPVRREVVTNEPLKTPIPNCLVVIVRNEDGSLATGVGVRIENTKERTRSATLIAGGADPRAVFSKCDLALVARPLGANDPLDVVVHDREIASKPRDLSAGNALGRVIEVILAPVGTVEVEVCANGERLHEATRVRLHRARPAASSTARIDSMASDELYTSNGLAIFRGVAIDTEVRASAEFDGVEFESRRAADVGPDRGGVTRLRIDVVPNPHLVFRLVDSAGKPFGFVNVEASFRCELDHELRLITTDTAGRARVSIPRSTRSSGPGDVWLTLERHQGDQLYRGRFSIGSYLDPGEHDLGNLVLERLEPVVQGRVVGPHGEPISNAMVTLARRASNTPGTNAALSDGSEEFSTSATKRCEMDGAFAFYSFVSDLDDGIDAADYVLFARHPAYVSGPPSLLRGVNRDLRIALETGGAIHGSLALANSRPAGVSLRLSRDWKDGEPSGIDDVRTETVEDPEDFLVKSLRPGSWKLEVLFGGLLTDAVVDGLIVLPGEVTNDPRLLRLAARISGKSIRIAVVDSRTHETLHSTIQPLDDEARVDFDAGSTNGRTDDTLHDVWLKDESTGCFLVTADDHRSAVIEHVRESTTVELAPEPGLALRIHGYDPSVSGNHGPTWVRLVPGASRSGTEKGDSNGPQPVSEPTFSGFVDHGCIVLEAIPAPGRYQVHWVHGRLSPASNDELVTDLTIPEHTTAITLDVEAPKPAAR